MKASKPRGITLTELLVVVGIMGVLASILMPTAKTIRIRAYEKACQAEIRDFERACRSFHEDFGFYPPDTFGTSYNTYTDASGQRRNEWRLSPLLRGCPARSDILHTPDDITGPENTSICMVFFLGSEFIIGGKSYGPYCEFRKEQLAPHPDQAAMQYKTYPAKGTATGSPWRVYGQFGARGYGSDTIPWEIRGVYDDNPGEQVRLYQYMDRFGPARRHNYRYFDYYVYDCHFPEGWRVYGPEPQPPDHNVNFVDISCYGYDGSTSVNVSEDEGGDAVGEGDEDGGGGGGGGPDDVGGARGKELRGMYKDDINNWTQDNVWPRRK